MKESDISKRLISANEIRENLVRIFPDSLILNAQHHIVGIGENPNRLLGYSGDELIGQSMGSLFHQGSAGKEFQKHFARGFFDNFTARLTGNKNVLIDCRMSAFYLGLITDINGIAIVQIKVADEQKILNNHLDASRDELDEFVYRTTHDLRGPLATIQGLLNLMKLEEPTLSEYVNVLISHIGTSAQILGDRLQNLNYLSAAASSKSINYSLDCAELESTLRSTLEQNLDIDTIDFQIRSSQRFYTGINASLTTGLLNHLLLYLISLPRNADGKIVYTIDLVKPGLRVVIDASGFVTSHQLRQAIVNKNPLYTTIISYGELINFFAASKSADQMRAVIAINSIQEFSQQIQVTVPECVDKLF